MVAGGTGTRMGGGLPKQFLPLAGRPVMVHTLERFLAFDPNMPVVVVQHPGSIDLWEEICQENLSPEHQARIHTCPGGAQRTHSVHNGLKQLEALVDDPSQYLVAIHDAARPNVTTGLIQRSFDLARKSGSSIPVWPVSDSLRHVQGDQHQAVLRSEYVTVQTPQVFDLALIKRAYQQAFSDEFTDDASVVEKMGEQVSLVQGSPGNTKITSKPDLDFLRFQLLKH